MVGEGLLLEVQASGNSCVIFFFFSEQNSLESVASQPNGRTKGQFSEAHQK